MDLERASFLSHWREISEYIMPRRPRFNTSEINRGEKKNQKIIDSTGVMALRTLRSGMMSGITSPARPWFRLTTPDSSLAEFGPVKKWLSDVQQGMSDIFLKSNLYNALPILYGDMGAFGTAAMLVDEDFEDTLRFNPFPIGSYHIANNEKLKVNVFHREFKLTVRQVVEKFGQYDEKTGKAKWDNFSTYIKNMWDRSQYETWIELRHFITPNKEFDPKKLNAKFKRYQSCYYESGYLTNGQANYFTQNDSLFLRESGYDYFPVLAPRWELSGEDVYGSDCPGMSALSDVKALQTLQKRNLQAVEKMVNPPMIAPSSMADSKASILPGDITYADERDGQKGFRPVHEVSPRLNELLIVIQNHQQRIDKAFFADLFLMLTNTDRREITAREVEERHDEKLLALGPVLEQLNQDLLDPLIDIAFDIMLSQGRIPEIPNELRGVPLKVEYISIMAQAQKLIGLSSVERFAGFIGQVAAAVPTVLDKLDADQLVDVYGDLTSVPPGVVRPDEEVQQMRAQREQQARAMQQAEMMKSVAGSAKDLSQTDLGGNNALNRMISDANSGALVQ